MIEPTEKITDEALAVRAKHGDADCMDALLTRHKAMVLQSARAFFLEGGSGEDLVQEGMIGLYRAILRFDEVKSPSFRSFAQLCVKHQIIDAVRKHNSGKNFALNNTVPLDEESGLSAPLAVCPETRLLSVEACEEIREKYKSLSKLERLILEKYLDGKSYAQISSEISSPEKSVDNAIQRIRKKLT